jgi:multidrug efflux pump
VNVDRDTASRLGVTSRDVDNALYDAFGQRQVATIYSELNQYHVIMEVAQRYARGPQALEDIYVPAFNSTGSKSGSSSTGSTNGSTSSTSSTTSSTTTASASSSTTAASTSPVSSSSSIVNPALRDQSSGQTISTTPSTMVPLAAFARFSERATASSVNHQDAELATTVSFNLAPGYSLSDAQAAISQAEAEIAMPNNVRGSFQGTARSYQESQGQQPLLIAAALIVIYIVLGVLYESLVHPVTVLSTLPSAGVGAVLALLLFKMEFSIIALIGVFLLIGIVKKNAILIIDFALEAERARGLSALEAVREACLLRFRPILMTTLAAALGALPLAIGFGEGSELRQPLGIAIIGGLIASQLLTLLTTPVVYLFLDKLRRHSPAERQLSRAASGITEPETI